MKIWAAVLCLVASCSSCKEPQKQAPPPAPTPEVKQSSNTPPPSLEMPEVTGGGVMPVGELGPKLVMSKDDISLDGDPVVAINTNVIDPHRLESLMVRLEAKATGTAPIAVTLDATLPYFKVGMLFSALKQAGFRNLALLTGNGSTMIPLELFDAEDVSGKGLRPVVTVKQNMVSLWSQSGDEGTKVQPKLSYALSDPPDFAPVRRALADIVQTRFPGHKRDPADLTIVLQLDSSRSAQTLLQLAAAVRTDGSMVLFPNIYLTVAR